MVDRTALKVGVIAAAVVVGGFLLRWLVAWVVRLVQVVGVALVAAAVAYVAYRAWAALRGGGSAGEATRDATAEVGAGSPADGPVDDMEIDRPGAGDLEAGVEADTGELTDEEFQRELEDLDS